MIMYRHFVVVLALLGPIITAATPVADPAADPALDPTSTTTPTPPTSTSVPRVTVDDAFDIRFGDPSTVVGGCGEKEGDVHLKIRAWFADCQTLAEAAMASLEGPDETSRKLRLTFLAYKKNMETGESTSKFLADLPILKPAVASSPVLTPCQVF